MCIRDRDTSTGTSSTERLRSRSTNSSKPVSYTHLDVYKRQAYPYGLAYRAETDTVYFIMNGELHAITGMDVATMQSVAEIPLNLSLIHI